MLSQTYWRKLNIRR